MYGYVVTTFKHIDNLEHRADIQSAILDYITHKCKGRRYIIEETGEHGNNPHWNIFLEHKKPAHLLAYFENYYTKHDSAYWVRGKTVITRRVKTDIDASFIINGYLTKESNYKIILDTLTADYKEYLMKLYNTHDHKTNSPDKVIKRFCRLTDTEFFNMLYDAYYPVYEQWITDGEDPEDMDIGTEQFKNIVKKIGKDYNIQTHLNKLSSFYIQLKMSYSVCSNSDLNIFI